MNASVNGKIQGNDYASLSQSELVELLESRDQEITSLKADKISISLRLNDALSEVERCHRKEDTHYHTIRTLRKEKKQFSQSLKPYKKQIAELKKECRKLQTEADRANRELSRMKEKFSKQTAKLKAQIQNLKEQLLQARKPEQQYSRPKNFQNSSIPSSKSIGRAKVTNNRVKSGKKPGAQKGHKGHGRKDLEASRHVEHIPSQVLENPQDWERVENSTVSKKRINLFLLVDVCSHDFSSWRNKKTGQIIREKYPENLINEINYGSSIETFIAQLNIKCGVPIRDVSELLHHWTKGQINLSTGYVYSIQGKLANKLRDLDFFTTAEEILLSSGYLGDDATGVMVNGKNKNIYNSCSPEASLFYYRPKRGKEGVKGRAITRYKGPVVHDHDITYYMLATEEHQECNSHILRYLKSAMENEPDLKWPGEMHDHLQYCIHVFDHTGQAGEKRKGNEKQTSPESARQEYEAILTRAKAEMGANPKYADSVYHKDTRNLLKRLDDYKDQTLLFLEKEVPSHNNGCEKELRCFKRKMKNMGGFRSRYSDEELKTRNTGLSVNDFCLVLSYIRTALKQGDNPFESLAFLTELSSKE